MSKVLSLLVFSLLITSYGLAQIAIQDSILQSLAKQLKEHYVLPKTGQHLADSILEMSPDSSLNIDEYTHQLSLLMRRVSGDKHLFVFAAPKEVKSYQEDRIMRRALSTESNIKAYRGGIGYLRLWDFVYKDIHQGEKTASLQRAFQYLDNYKNGLILDLRYNRGGDAYQAAKLISFLSGKSDKYLFSVVEKGDTTKLNTPKTRGRGFYPPLYILTSQYSFSSGELAAYGLRKFYPGKLTIVGETTGGGGYGNYGLTCESQHCCRISEFTSFDADNNDFTWEAVGIRPDLCCPADSALQIAYFLACDSLDSMQLDSHYGPVAKNRVRAADYQDILGDYHRLRIFQKAARLHIQYDHRPPTPLLLSDEGDDIFWLPYFHKLWLLRDEQGKVLSAKLERLDGYIETYRKEN